mmetsp:Transcript_37146/g.44898  ORF Transcript_37146/g.44898 Transcript_37146/m.44898 type:complete len:199 (+) Transcript_37146:137-733(+)|eukprot:CAMPEP_0197851432 /NCGR_PEP_ID=MMETSP1438-20131217/18068_1 /TAXON_ID=1461541 /ORGANISM="Pterosperma sp., Strain CCMP1384" /LENGTH=198 /DNA_ID=CAMNT_0043465029 /DNA_START=130 /DNA_END=726 /DNA_ORIENTATION=+
MAAEGASVEDITVHAQTLVDQSRSLNAQLTEQLTAQPAATEVVPATTPMPVPVKEPAAVQMIPEPRAAAVEVAPTPQPGFCGIPFDDWAKILLCFTVLYLSLTAFYAALLTIAVEIRGGEQYKSLPSEYYGSFDRDYYYHGMGSRRGDPEVLYPWIKNYDCPNNYDNFVCTPQCDVPTQPFHKKKCQNMNCGVKCVNP